MAPPNSRLVASVLALLVTAGIVYAIIAGTGDPSGSQARTGAAAAADSYCGGFPGAASMRSPARAQSARYSNPLYGYAVTIPAGLTGHTPATGAARGFYILLSASPRAVLSVDAAYDALYDITAAGVHTRDTVNVRLFDRLLSDHGQPYSLAGIEGGRYRMQVACRGDPSSHVFEDVIVVRNREIYRLDLQSEAARLPQDEALLEAMARSWSWIPLRGAGSEAGGASRTTASESRWRPPPAVHWR